MSADGSVATTDQVPPAIARPELASGTRLGDRYRLIAPLGRGGGGAVWRAFDDKVGEELALKLIDGRTNLERWRREVALARRIAHDNVCRVHDLGEADGLRWVTMERIEGDSLRALLARGAIAQPARLARQLVDGVAAIHAAGVVHRDLKPENVVVDRGGRAVIVDFGLARRPAIAAAAPDPGEPGDAGDRTVTGHGAVLGTPRYMAPEQAAGEVADARSDVYALGLVLGEIAAGGRAASDRDDDAARDVCAASGRAGAGGRAASSRDDDIAGDRTVSARAAAGSPRFAPRGSRLPRSWGPVIARCVAPAPADRFADAVAVRAALAAAGRTRRLVIGGAMAATAAAVVLAVAIGMPARTHAPSPPLAVRRLTATAAIPASQPTSIAVSQDGKTLAYTVGLELVTRAIDGGSDAPVALPTTPGGMALARLVEVIGFLGDGRVAAQILDRDHAWALWALGAGHPPQVVYRSDERMIAGVSPRGDVLAVATPSAGLVAVTVASGATRPLVAARPGEYLGGPAWSPDGARVAFVRHTAGGKTATLEVVALAEPRAARVIARRRFADPVDLMLAWPEADRVVVAANAPDGAALVAVVVAGDSAAMPIVRWPDEYVAQLASGAGRLVVLRGTAEHAIQVGVVDPRGYFLNLQRGLPEHTSGGTLAGWTGDGRLVHAGDGGVVLRAPGGPGVMLAGGGARPDAVVGDAVLYHRAAADGDSALHRVALTGGDDRPLREPAGADGDTVRCAGDRAPPCVIVQIEGTVARYLRFDPATGARGDELHRITISRRLPAMAVSPDGATLAVADGPRVALIGPGGRVAHESLARSAEIVSLSWSHDGASLLVSALASGDDHASVIRLVPGGERQLLLHSDHRRYERIHETPAGDVVAVGSRDLTLDAWLIEGL